MIGQSRRIAAVQTPIIPTVQRWVRATPGTISLGQGIVAYGPPAEALEAARRFGAASAEHMYGPVEGLAEFTDALEGKLARENNIKVRPDSRIVVTAGSNMGFMNAILAILDPGDEVIIPVPYYFNHEMGVVMVDGKVVTVQTRPDYQLDLDAIADAITPRTRAVLTVSPNNPTGVVYPESDLRALNALCRDRGIFHLHDEAYEYFTYGNAKRFSPGSIAGAGDHTISMFSLSKGYGMASWRVGYMVIPHRLFDAVNKIQDTVLVCPPAISQMAGLAAVNVGQRHSAPGVAHLGRMRKVLAQALAQPDLPCETPAADGAFYFFTRVRTTMDPMTVAERLIREHRVAAMPGSAFGAAGCHFRLSYGLLVDETAKEGIDRLIRGLAAITGAAVR